MERPSESEYAPFYAGYVKLVPEVDIVEVLERQVDDVRRVAASVPEAKELYAYAQGKWTVRELFGHLTDAERVFGYRAFCISRGEKASLPAFDENDYMVCSPAGRCTLSDLVDELSQVRETNLTFLKRLDPAKWLQTGVANAAPVSVRAIGFIMAGHVRHHLAVLAARYGIGGS